MKYISIFLSLVLLTLGCTKEKMVTQEFLQGYWKSYSDPDIIYFAGSYYTLNFIEDSLQIEWNFFTDALPINNSCYPRELKNYIAGKYHINDFEIQIEAQYVDSSYSNLNTDTCRKLGTFINEGSIRRIKDTLFIDLPLSIYSDFGVKAKFLRK